MARRRHRLAFTIVELLVVLAIIALLGGLMLPNVSSMIHKAQSIKCAENLRSIGIALMQAAADNNNTYPEIEQGPPSIQIYPPGSGAQNIVGALGAYGITTNTVMCPTDLQQSPSSFSQYSSSSYQWDPIYDDSVTTSALITVGGFIQIPMHSARVRLCTDFLPIHGKAGHPAMNALYGDGHVVPR